MSKNIGNNKVVNSNTFYFSPAQASGIDELYLCCICKKFWNNTPGSALSFRQHIVAEHGYVDSG